ncbi:MAG: 16S rRNA (uracil(1498)-N(3))-methyltransferase [Nitrospira bacterium HGW-Nitrospira-1]|nr:MAG: 16S rRNA (uracil(1498)-N(3))-methyltransferase [Nitrospira bacterium HGW-Nitrospira-1]
MHRIFLQQVSLLKHPVVIKDEKAHYLFSVLRCKTGDGLIVTDEKGCSYTAQILSASKKEVTMDITGNYIMNTESALNIILIQGLLKGEKMDIVIQKTTELGVNAVIPVITERSQIRETRKHLRWKKIAEEASRQSGRTRMPEIFETCSFTEVFNIPDLISGKGIIFWEEGGEKLPVVINKLSHRDRIFLFIGPEGGFSEKEVLSASEKGFFIATLGSRILKAETAAITAVSIIQFALGDMGY